MKSLELDPNIFEPNANLGEIYLVFGRDREALSAFLTAARIKPNDPNLHFDLGQVYMRLGKREDALDELQTLKRLGDPLADDLEKQLNLETAKPDPPQEASKS